MDITPLIPQSSKVIQAYGSDGFKVSNDVFDTGVVITSDQVFEWTAKPVTELKRTDFSFLNDLDIEVLLIGTGQSMVFIDKDLKLFLLTEYGLTAEVMDTGAAARTYNILLSEGRKVCASLLLYK